MTGLFLAIDCLIKTPAKTYSADVSRFGIQPCSSSLRPPPSSCLCPNMCSIPSQKQSFWKTEKHPQALLSLNATSAAKSTLHTSGRRHRPTGRLYARVSNEVALWTRAVLIMPLHAVMIGQKYHIAKELQQVKTKQATAGAGKVFPIPVQPCLLAYNLLQSLIPPSAALPVLPKPSPALIVL